MRRSLARSALGLPLLLIASLCSAGSQAAAPCVGPSSGVPRSALVALARGVNVSGWTDGPKSLPPSASLLRAVRQAGMTHVRLPVSAELVMRAFSPEDVVRAQLIKVDAALTELTALGFHVSVDMHPSDRFGRLHRSEPRAALEALHDGWKNLAGVIRKHPTDPIFAELLNEPDISPDRWRSEVQDLAAFVRSLLPKTTLIVGPTNWQRADSLPEFQPLADQNVVYAIHFYDPMVFTHQGHWNPADPLSAIRGLPFPIRRDDPDVEAIRKDLAALGRERSLQELDRAIEQSAPGQYIARQLLPAVAWQEKYSRPLIINEFGVLKEVAPKDSRLRWIGSVVDSAEANCWGWTHWELNQGFGIVDQKTGSLDPDTIRVLMQPR